MSYCETDGGWCSEDHYASKFSYATWLSAVCLATAAMMWYEKKLMIMVLLWYITAMFFIFVSNGTIWAILLAVDLLVYYTLFGDHDDDDDEDGGDEKQKYDRSSLDPFGERATRELLDAVIEDKLVMKRDEKLIAMLRNKQKLEREAKRRKREAERLGKKRWTLKLRETIQNKWEELKSTFYGIKRDKNITMDKYVSEESQKKEVDNTANVENNGLLDDEWINQDVEEDTDSTADSTR